MHCFNLDKSVIEWSVGGAQIGAQHAPDKSQHGKSISFRDSEMPPMPPLSECNR